MKARQIILIGGAPTTGKSMMAQALSKVLDLPWISTDQIRAIMRSVASKDQYPGLFNSSGYDAERFLTELTPKQIVDMEFAQGKETWLGVRALIHDVQYEWTGGCIVEGVGILPSTVAADFGKDPTVRTVFLIDRDLERMRKTVYARGLWDEAHSYSDHLKEKEVAWASLYAQRLEAEAKKYDYPWIEVHKRSDDVQRVLKLLHANRPA